MNKTISGAAFDRTKDFSTPLHFTKLSNKKIFASLRSAMAAAAFAGKITERSGPGAQHDPDRRSEETVNVADPVLQEANVGEVSQLRVIGIQ
jgi:hypothetical protein